MNTKRLASLVLLASSLGLGLAACGGGTMPSPATEKQQYEEYTCPDPIGKIVREDCQKQALQYQGESFEGSVGAAGVGASASYKQSAVREADSLVQLLKEQRVAMCNNFNTCKLTVAEYRQDQKRLDDSFIALMALKDKMSNVDADGATKLLDEIRSIREGAQVKAAPADAGKPGASAGATSNTGTPASTPAAPAFTCKGPALMMYKRGTIAGPNFGYDKTRESLKGHPELSGIDFLEFVLEGETITGEKKQEYVLVGVAPDSKALETLRGVVKTINPSAGQDIGCPAKAPARKLEFDVK